jgi:hypothetical protein
MNPDQERNQTQIIHEKNNSFGGPSDKVAMRRPSLLLSSSLQTSYRKGATIEQNMVNFMALIAIS